MSRVDVLVLGSAPEAFRPGLLGVGLPEDRSALPSVPVPRRFLDGDGSLRADLLLGDGDWPPASVPVGGKPPGATLVITGRPLSTRECSRVLGLSNRRKGMAVVSAWALGENPRRLRNLALHELGHLKGWRHCRTPGCLMAPVKDPAELDGRQDGRCRQCTRGRGEPEGGRPVDDWIPPWGGGPMNGALPGEAGS